MAARHHPGLVRDPGRIGTKSNIVAANLDDAQSLSLLLSQNVAENAALFRLIVVAPGAQLVEHAARHERSCRQLRSRMFKFLSRPLSVIFEDADVLQAAVTLQILNSLH